MLQVLMQKRLLKAARITINATSIETTSALLWRFVDFLRFVAVPSLVPGTPEVPHIALLSKTVGAQNATALREALGCYQSLGTKLTFAFTSQVRLLIEDVGRRCRERQVDERSSSATTASYGQSNVFFLGLGNCLPVVSAAQLAVRLRKELNANALSLTACTIFNIPAIRTSIPYFKVFHSWSNVQLCRCL